MQILASIAPVAAPPAGRRAAARTPPNGAPTLMRTRTTAAALAALALAPTARGQGAADTTRAPRRAPLLAQELPPMRGDRLKVTTLEVVYPPGAASAPHVHPCPVFGYIAAGALRMQFKGLAERVYRAGESFYEAANGGHLVGANASATEPAKLVATFVCDRDGPLSTPLGDTASSPAPGRSLAQPPQIATALSFTEGPTVDRDGNVYFSEMVWQRIMKLSPEGELTVFREHSNAANGLLIDPQGRLVACEGAESQRRGMKESFRPRVTRTDLRTGKVEVLADSGRDTPLVGPNDVTVDGKGRLYFTDLIGGAVYRIDPPPNGAGRRGRVTRILARPDVQRPNGIQISPDDRTLYLVEANGAADGARMIRAYDLAADGTVSNMRVHYNFSPGRSADGMSIDTQGNLWASAGMNQLRGTAETLDTKTGIYVISPQGKLLDFIPIPEDYITNNAFGGADMKTLYVTAGKTLYTLRTDVAGLPR
jgi:gluconolactonase